MKKLVFFSPIASPHQVRFCAYLRKYFDAEFYFYERCSGRQAFWAVPLEEHCHVLPTRFKWHRRYCTLSVLKVLDRIKPDIVMFGGLSIPSNYFAYRWALRHGAKTVVQTERSRVVATGKPREYDLTWRALHWLYRKIDRIMVTALDILPQFRDTFRFGDKVVVGQYPADIDRYYRHPVRGAQKRYTLIFPNRLTEIYNPLGAVRIFDLVRKRYPETRLKMNAAGELRPEVEKLITDLGIADSVEFLDDIKTWDDLGEIYKNCDIVYLPAKFSNGNYTIIECQVSGMGSVISEKVLGGICERMKRDGVGFVLPVDNVQFADRICWYIEHPEAFAREAEINRKVLFSATNEATARLYFDLLGSL